MFLKPGDEIGIQNFARSQGIYRDGPRFVIHDVSDYKGQLIVYATKLPHQQRVFIHGVETIPERAGCFVILMNEPEDITLRLIRELRGFPLYLTKGQDRVYIVNWRSADLPGISDGPTNDKDKLVGRAANVIDLYQVWRDAGHVMPVSFCRGRDNPAERNGVPR